MSEPLVVIVTGGTRGIGADISLMFAKAGHRVTAVYVSNRSKALTFEEKLKSVSTDSEVFQADVSQQAGVDAVVGHVADKYGRIDVLVNNAGVFDFKFIEEMDEAFLDRIFQVNFKSQVLMTQACVRHMKKNRFGRIFNASSISGSVADVGLVAYGASKAAVDMLTKISAAELGPYNITVNAYAPGIIHTDLTDSMIRERGHLQVKQIPLHRFGTGEEVASLLLYLASPQAGYITGEIIGVNGGMMKVQNPYRAHEKAERNHG